MSRAFFARLFLARRRAEGVQSIALSPDPGVPRQPGDTPTQDALGTEALVLSRCRRMGQEVDAVMLACAEARFELRDRPGEVSAAATVDDFALWVGHRHHDWPRYTGRVVKLMLASADERVKRAQDAMRYERQGRPL